MRASDFITEKWSAKYKRSINCNNPKGFSQRAHCQGRKKKTEENFVRPQFDFEWSEAERYPEFRKIGKQAWIELASTGRAVTISDASDINNTDAADPDSFKNLNPAKQKRALAQVNSGKVELPLVAVYSDGHKELIGGNTRLTAMLATQGKAAVWQFAVPDEVAELAENVAEGMGASAGGGTAGSAGAGGSSLGLPYPSTYEEENDKFKRKGQERTVAMTTEQTIYKRDDLPQLNKSHFENGDFEIEEGEIKLSKLIPIQTERVKGLVKKTIKMIEDGKDKPLIIDRKGRIVNGHHRYDAYKKLGYKKVPVLKVNATVEQLIDKYMKQD
jgi:hypothetical protein